MNEPTFLDKLPSVPHKLPEVKKMLDQQVPKKSSGERAGRVKGFKKGQQENPRRGKRYSDANRNKKKNRQEKCPVIITMGSATREKKLTGENPRSPNRNRQGRDSRTPNGVGIGLTGPRHTSMEARKRANQRARTPKKYQNTKATLRTREERQKIINRLVSRKWKEDEDADELEEKSKDDTE